MKEAGIKSIQYTVFVSVKSLMTSDVSNILSSVYFCISKMCVFPLIIIYIKPFRTCEFSRLMNCSWVFEGFQLLCGILLLDKILCYTYKHYMVTRSKTVSQEQNVK